MYIDSGTGSLILQIIAASFFTMVLFFRNILSFCHLTHKETQRKRNEE